MTTRTPVTAHGFTEGNLARVRKTGRIVRLEDVNPTDRWKDDEIFAMGVTEYGTVDILSPDEIEPFDEPKIEASDLAKDLSSSLHSSFGDLSVSETEVDGNNVYVTGTMRGVPVEFTVSIINLTTTI